MTRHAAPFSQIDVTRAVRAVRKAGAPIARVEIEPGGKIVVVVGEPATAAPLQPVNEWDEVLEDAPQ